MRIAVAFARDGKKPAEARQAAHPDRDHQGQPRQGRARRRGEVSDRRRPDGRRLRGGRAACPPPAASAAPSPRRHMTDAPEAPLLRIESVSQALSRRAGARRRRHSRSMPGEVHAPARRERRRQVDAAEDHLRRADARCRHACTRQGEAVSITSPHAGPAARHRHDLPGVQPRPDADGGREHLHRARAAASRPLRRLARACAPMRAPITARIGLDIDPDALVSRPVRRRAADGRDRPRAVDELAPDHHGRADLGAVRTRRSTAFSASCATCSQQGIAVDVRHPPAGGGDGDLRPRTRSCATAGWSATRQGRRADDRRHHPR